MHRSLVFLVLFSFNASSFANDWAQWRGPGRDGFCRECPSLVNALPAEGLKPLWKCDAEIADAKSGGWASPVVVDGRVLVFAHNKVKVTDTELPPKKFPYLAPEKRGNMSASEYEEYERNRRDEDFERGKHFRYTELLFCLNQADGKVIWKNDRTSVYTRFPQSGTPTVVDGKIFILGAGLVARCVDLKTGKDLWQKQLPGKFRDEFLQSSFAVVDGVAGVLAGAFFALDVNSGDIRWQADADGSLDRHSSPAIWSAAGKNFFLVNLDGKETYCFDAKSGKEAWRATSEAGNSSPIVLGNRMLTYGNSRKKGLRAFSISADKAELLWTYQGLSDPGSSPVVVGDHVFVQGEKRLACVSLANGQATWTESLDMNQPRYTSLIAADGKVFYAFDGVLCFAADASAFRRLMNGRIDDTGLLAEDATFRKLLDIDRLEATAEGQKQADRIWNKKIDDHGPLSCSSPAIADGKLYVRLRGGVACYDLRASVK